MHWGKQKHKGTHKAGKIGYGGKQSSQACCACLHNSIDPGAGLPGGVKAGKVGLGEQESLGLTSAHWYLLASNDLAERSARVGAC